jgi:hypothetical protein
VEEVQEEVVHGCFGSSMGYVDSRVVSLLCGSLLCTGSLMSPDATPAYDRNSWRMVSSFLTLRRRRTTQSYVLCCLPDAPEGLSPSAHRESLLNNIPCGDPPSLTRALGATSLVNYRQTHPRPKFCFLETQTKTGPASRVSQAL